MPEMLSLSTNNLNVFRERATRSSYFPHKSHTYRGNGTGCKIGAREAIQERLEWENLIFFAA